MRGLELCDYKGYSEAMKAIDAAILDSLESGGRTAYDLQEILLKIGIGDSKTVGGIQRAAMNSLRMRNLIHDSWDTRSRPYERPFRYFIGGRSTKLAVCGL